MLRGSGARPHFVVGGGAVHSEWFTCQSDRVTQLSVALPRPWPAVDADVLEYRYRPLSATFIVVAVEDSDVAGGTLPHLRKLYRSRTEP